MPLNYIQSSFGSGAGAWLAFIMLPLHFCLFYFYHFFYHYYFFHLLSPFVSLSFVALLFFFYFVSFVYIYAEIIILNHFVGARKKCANKSRNTIVFSHFAFVVIIFSGYCCCCCYCWHRIGLIL